MLVEVKVESVIENDIVVVENVLNNIWHGKVKYNYIDDNDLGIIVEENVEFYQSFSYIEIRHIYKQIEG